MNLGMIVETSEPERVWNAFRLASTALAAGHQVEVFLLGDGVEAPDLDTESFNPHGVLANFDRTGGTVLACGTCLDARGLDDGDLRPRASMQDLLGIIERADQIVTIG